MQIRWIYHQHVTTAFTLLQGNLWFCRVIACFSVSWTLRNLISTRNQIVFIIFRLIWNQMDVRLVPNQSQNGKYNLISGWFNNISQCAPSWRYGAEFMRGGGGGPESGPNYSESLSYGRGGKIQVCLRIAWLFNGALWCGVSDWMWKTNNFILTEGIVIRFSIRFLILLTFSNDTVA